MLLISYKTKTNSGQLTNITEDISKAIEMVCGVMQNRKVIPRLERELKNLYELITYS